MQKRTNKKGQVTIFVITAVIIVVAIIIFFLARGKIINDSNTTKDAEDPNQYLAECISAYLSEASKLLIEGNGYVGEPPLPFEYKYEKIPYLCFTPNPYSRCITVEPVIIDHLKEELYIYLTPKIEECMAELETDLESDGFSVIISPGGTFTVEIMPRKVEVVLKKEIEINKAGEKKGFNKFTSSAITPLYDFARIIQRITEEEAKYTNSEYENMMISDPWMDINKFVTGDSNKVYTLTDTKTGLSWRFAVRGGVLATPS